MEILIVDDDRLSRMLIRAILKKTPEWNLTEAEDGQAAWDMLTGGLVVDLVLTDIFMPRLTGVELLKKIRGDVRFKNLRVIMSTAVTSRTTIEEVGKLGADYYLLKPISGEILRDQIRRVENELASSSPIEDPAITQQRLGIDEPTYDEFVKLLSQDLQASLTKMRNADAQANQSAAEYRLNSLGGTASNLGLVELSRAILAAEQASKSSDTSAFSSHLTRVETESQRVTTLLSKREQSRKPASP